METDLSRRNFIGAAGLGAAGLVLSRGVIGGADGQPTDAPMRSERGPSAPNVLYIMSDQHNAKFLGCKGHPNAKTPNLDRLASEGVRFDNAICQNPICTPSRVSYLTGQYCHNHGYYGLCGPEPKGLPTIFGHFRRAGYTTGAVGKIHCPAHLVENDTDYFSDALGCSVGGKSDYVAFLQEKDLLHLRDDSRYPENPTGMASYDGRPSGLAYEDSIEAWIARQATAFCERASAKKKPFFLEVSFPRPHQKYCPSEPFWSMYDEKDIVFPPNAKYDMTLKPPHMRKEVERFRDGWWIFFQPKTFDAAFRRALRGYLGCVSQVDHAVGALLNWLDKHGLRENTIVIYAADHGDFAGEHGMMEKAPGICADAITRVPMVWRWPSQFQAGHVAQEIVETVDMSTTLCELAGLTPFETSDGVDISPLLRGGTGDVHRIGVTENVWSKSVRKGRFRYVHYVDEMFADKRPSGGFGELYDIEDDPWEMHNLYFEPALAGTVIEFRRDLLDWLITSSRPATVWPPANWSSGQAYCEHPSAGAFVANTVNRDGKIAPEKVRELNRQNQDYV